MKTADIQVKIRIGDLPYIGPFRCEPASSVCLSSLPRVSTPQKAVAFSDFRAGTWELFSSGNITTSLTLHHTPINHIYFNPYVYAAFRRASGLWINSVTNKKARWEERNICLLNCKAMFSIRGFLGVMQTFLRIIGFLTLSIVRYSKKSENTTFQKLDLFPSSYEWRRHLVCWVPQREPTSITGPG
jgi:hypothetical protein